MCRCDSGSTACLPGLLASTAGIFGADELQRESVRIHHMETDTALFILRSDAPRLQIRGHGFLVEVFDSDGDVVYLARRLAGAEDQEFLAQHDLVISVAFVNRATQYLLVEIA